MGCGKREDKRWSRREWLTATAGLAAVRPLRAAPSAPVAIGRCDTYGPEMMPVMDRMFDQLGGLGRLVKGKTVAIKVNMTGTANIRFGHHPAGDTYWTHPAVIGAVVYSIGKAGARCIRILESFSQGAAPLEEHMLQAGWEPNDLSGAAPKVEFENTAFLGYGKDYSRMMVAGDGYIYPGFDLNHSYADCDVFVSIAKLKEHITAGVTLAMKNLFGIAPPTIYGSGAGEDEPALTPNGGRNMFHTGYRQPSKSAPQEIRFGTSGEGGGYRVPRIVVDLGMARPIHLSIMDGIASVTGGEGPWVERGGRYKLHPVQPRVLIAGTNPVTTDAVGMAAMGFDPMAVRGRPPFEDCDSTLNLAEHRGIGTRDLNRIEVVGAPLSEIAVPFREVGRISRL